MQARGSTREGAVWQRSVEKFANFDSLLQPRNVDDRPSTRARARLPLVPRYIAFEPYVTSPPSKRPVQAGATDYVDYKSLRMDKRFARCTIQRNVETLLSPRDISNLRYVICNITYNC